MYTPLVFFIVLIGIIFTLLWFRMIKKSPDDAKKRRILRMMDTDVMSKTLKRFALLSLYSNEHSDSPDRYNKEWLKYEYLDPREKLVIGSKEDYENFKKYISE